MPAMLRSIGIDRARYSLALPFKTLRIFLALEYLGFDIKGLELPSQYLGIAGLTRGCEWAGVLGNQPAPRPPDDMSPP